MFGNLGQGMHYFRYWNLALPMKEWWLRFRCYFLPSVQSLGIASSLAPWKLATNLQTVDSISPFETRRLRLSILSSLYVMLEASSSSAAREASIACRSLLGNSAIETLFFRL